ncbi:sugar-binding protein [Chryseobacterium phosphatilyticum]|uniref:Sugar-binding protein n=1 Tax=Chryseobacterium phosphatilyticum TaxID=475075 RepID=A0A316XFC3_9FLAO|nr:DUF6443 domain-containing protein [Chryseobacterium phosphatilyticum]PWN72244.1 sugar-binding protein [Chryseobacterium phosphatilyticum]
MKRIITPIGIFLFTGLIKAQLSPLPNTENYIQTKTYLDYNGTQVTKSSETVQYFDGLGRPKQVISIKATPQGKDVVTHIEYDQFGRQIKDYLPIPQQGTQNGTFYASPLGNASSVYGNEKIFSEKVLENSPLDRIKQQIQVGNDWSSKPVNFGYEANTVADGVRKFTTTTIWVDGATKSDLAENWLYTDGQLYKNTVTDEDGNKTTEFKNGQGQTIMVKKEDGSSTYYVYNEYNQLAFVIPPLASVRGDIVANTAKHDELCYQYRYDGRNRLVEKKLPGKGWEYMIYDKQDRLVATRDANLKAKGQWLYTKYDKLGRAVITGISTGGERTTEQTLADLQGNNSVNRISTPFFNRQGMEVYYDNPEGSYPKSPTWVTLLSLHYYDSYPGYSFNSSFPSTIQGESILTSTLSSDGRSTNGLPVMSVVKNIEDDNWTKNYSYYDNKGRVIGSYSINHLGGYTQTESKLDFAGTPQMVVTRHKRLNTDTERVITENFEYDHQNRLLVHKHQVDSNPVEVLTQNTYNEIGQLINKKTGNTTGTPLQSVDMAYNIRGWLTRVNDPSNLSGKLFAYEIKYQNPVYFNVSTGKYNGNIAEIDWVSADNGKLRRYNYQYDSLERLKSGIYSEPNATVPQNNYYNETLSYDVNGNILNLKRNRFIENLSVELMDNLNYTYTGNRLNKVDDVSGNYGGYPSPSGSPMTYDNNGNMTSHFDKGILQIDYNYLNLPNYVKFDKEYVSHDFTSTYYVNTKYLYNAAGIKLRKIHTYGAGRTDIETIEKTDYLDGFQYSEDELSFIPTPEGYYDFKKNTYIYNYTDQLGNIRLAYYKDASGNVRIDRATHYYPFGLEFGGELSTSNSITPNYTYSSQGQEKQRETGWSSYRWRNYDAAMARFFNVDPLSEKYAYQSHYNFSENRVVDGRELEGLEWANVKNDQGVTTNRQLTVSITNNTNLNDKQFNKVVESIKTAFSKTFSADGAKAELIVSDKATMKVEAVNEKSVTITNENGEEFSTFKGGVTATLGETQKNNFTVTTTVDGSKRENNGITRSFNHEAAHSAGLDHPWENRDKVSDINQGSKNVSPKTIKGNLLNSGANPVFDYKQNAGSNLTPGQFKKMDETIQSQQPK